MPGIIETKLAPYPSAQLSRGPTPLHPLPRLSAELGCSVHVLREDLTGFALGGNKVRKLDYLLGAACARGATTLLTRNASSFSRNAAAAGQRFGLDVHVVVPGEEADHNAASRELFQQLDAHLYHDADYEGVRRELTDQGKSVYELHPGGSDEIGALGYLHVFEQIRVQSEATAVHFHRIYVPTGSTATQVGLVLGQALTGYDTLVIGVATSQKADVQRPRVLDLTRSTAALLEMTFDEALVKVDDRFLGEGYAIPSPEGREAVQLFARREGILLDQVYGGKAAAALIHDAREGVLSVSEPVLFIHTGGNAGLYY